MDINKLISEELNVEKWQVDAAVKLLDEGSTVPFISRYRKEVTGQLNDEQLRKLSERLTYLRNLEDKKATVLGSIAEQGKLTDELRDQILNAETQVAVDDLYRPYRPKRRTRATIAKEQGLEPLANVILLQQTDKNAKQLAADYVNEEKGVKTVKEALQGALDIIAEIISDNPDYRKVIRDKTFRLGKITSVAKEPDKKTVYDNYYKYEEPILKIAGHRVLAVNRGEAEKVLTVKIAAPTDEIVEYLESQVIVRGNPNTTPLLKIAVADSYSRLIEPSIATEIRNALTEKAEDGAIAVFGKNLEQLLMQPPIVGKVVLGWDPAFRTGCKLAVVDATGKVLETAVIFPTAPTTPEKIARAKLTLQQLILKHKVSLISLGNGTASRESEQIIVQLLRETGLPVQYVIVNEAGASVYSASKLATEEFPNFDVGQRSAASIARRLQDPLAELVKIDPQSIGVGQYQHDMNQKKLGETLHGVVEDCVNKVGVDLNTASVSLLTYISGINASIAKNIVAYREKHGRFTNRQQLLQVDKLGAKAFEQCAGFLRISGGDNPLDGTSVHPESYSVATTLMKRLNILPQNIGNLKGLSQKIEDMGRFSAKSGTFTLSQLSINLHKPSDGYSKLAAELGVGELTLRDIVSELEKPARDPRDEMPKPILRTDVLEMKDLKEGMILKGTVRNVIDFGVFVDIGVHQDGLVHISQLNAKKYVKHPLEVVKVGDIVEVKVLSVDMEKKRIALTMII